MAVCTALHEEIPRKEEIVTNRKRNATPQIDPGTVAWEMGRDMVARHPLFSGLMSRVQAYRNDLVPRDRWTVVTVHGHVQTHPKRRAEPEEWAYALAHGLLHLAFGHLAGAVGKEPRA